MTTMPVQDEQLETVSDKSVESIRQRLNAALKGCLLYTSPSPRDQRGSRMPSSA